MYKHYAVTNWLEAMFLILFGLGLVAFVIATCASVVYFIFLFNSPQMWFWLRALFASFIWVIVTAVGSSMAETK